jgi:hypothetical protein
MRLLISGATKSMARFAADPEIAPHIGHLWTPATGNDLVRQARTQLPWACDNAAFGRQWNAERFQKAILFKVPHCPVRPMFVPVPDVVGDSRATLELFYIWRPIMRAAGLPLALVLQDGSESQLLPWHLFDVVFVGGSRRYLSGQWGKGPYSEWKESRAAADLIREAKRRGKRVHAGRVNGLKRLRHFFELKVDTADGSSLSMYADTWVPKFVAALREWRNDARSPATQAAVS